MLCKLCMIHKQCHVNHCHIFWKQEAKREDQVPFTSWRVAHATSDCVGTYDEFLICIELSSCDQFSSNKMSNARAQTFLADLAMMPVVPFRRHRISKAT